MNVQKLHKSLSAAGVPHEGCDINGRISFLPQATTEQRALAARIVAVHDPSPTYDELRKKEYPPEVELIVALWEKVVEGRTEPTAEIQARREEIKLKYPKPGET